jgi:hypothetical protein
MQFSQKCKVTLAFLLPYAANFSGKNSQNQEARAFSQESEKNLCLLITLPTWNFSQLSKKTWKGQVYSYQ